MRWRFLPTHRALVGWGGIADKAREASHSVMRCCTNTTHPTAPGCFNYSCETLTESSCGVSHGVARTQSDTRTINGPKADLRHVANRRNKGSVIRRVIYNDGITISCTCRPPADVAS